MSLIERERGLATIEENRRAMAIKMKASTGEEKGRRVPVTTLSPPVTNISPEGSGAQFPRAETLERKGDGKNEENRDASNKLFGETYENVTLSQNRSRFVPIAVIMCKYFTVMLQLRLP